jgi:hypothetical protein
MVKLGQTCCPLRSATAKGCRLRDNSRNQQSLHHSVSKSSRTAQSESPQTPTSRRAFTLLVSVRMGLHERRNLNSSSPIYVVYVSNFLKLFLVRQCFVHMGSGALIPLSLKQRSQKKFYFPLMSPVSAPRLSTFIANTRRRLGKKVTIHRHESDARDIQARLSQQNS